MFQYTLDKFQEELFKIESKERLKCRICNAYVKNGDACKNPNCKK